MTRARIFSQALANIIAGGGGGSANITFASLQPFLTTANVIELTNLYFSNARVFANLQLASINDFYDVVTTNTANGQTLVWNGYEWTSSNVSSVANLSLSTTNDLNEGSSNLYYTNARARTAFTAGNPTIIIDWNAGTIIANVESIAAASGTTDTVPEGFTNKYFTNARVYSNVELMSINVLADVNISGAENGQVLTYDSSTSTWISANASSAASAQSSENANIANLVLSINNFTTANLTESASNLYFTAARVNAVIQPFLTAANIADFASTVNATIFPFLTTSNVSDFSGTVNATVRPILTTANVVESSSNLYFTTARVNATVQPFLTAANIANFTSTVNTTVRPILTTANVTESSSNLYFTYARANEAIWPSLTTSNVIEGTNQYFTNARIFTGLLTDNANVKDITVNGNLLVYGNLALLNVGNVQISSRTITIAKDAQNATQAEGSGILINGANAKITYGQTGDYIGINKNITVYGNILPAVSGIFNLGAPDKKFLSLYLGTQTIFLGNVSLGESPSGGLQATSPTGDPTDGSFANLTAVQSITVDRVYGNVFPLSEFASYIGGNATQFVSNVTGNLYLGIRKDSDWNKFAGIRIVERRDLTGNIVSDVIVYNDSENTNNSTARISVLGSGNVEIDADVVIRGNLDVRKDITANGRITFTSGDYIQQYLNPTPLTINGVHGIDLQSNNTIAWQLKENSYDLVATHSNKANIVTNGSVTGTTFYGNVRANTILTNSLNSNTAILGNIVVGTASFDNVISKVATFDTVVVNTNLFVYGDVTTYGANNLSVSDNMIYLNNGSETNDPDIGFTFNYNDGVYQHGGFFRDASDGVFKAFDSYTLEPDANIFIDTSHPSFRLANIQATNFIGNVTGFVTGQVSSLANHDTGDLAEGTNQYFTNVRVLQVIDPKLTTANISELNNQYFTNVRVLQVIDPKLTTGNVTELNNLYFTNARVLSNVEQMSINVFADVDITDIQNNGILQWNGNKFVAGSIGVSQFAESSNVSLFAYVANIANIVSTLSNFTTANLVEGTNQYFTNDRVVTAVTPLLTTSNVTEGTNQYFTNARVITAVTPLLTAANIINFASTVNVTVQPFLTTANVVESSSNLYFTNNRVVSALIPGNNIIIEANGRISASVFAESVNLANISLFANVANTVLTLSNFTTANLVEGTNQYFTNDRVVTAVTPLLTAANIVNFDNRVNTVVQPFLTTANVTELGNQYFTNAKVISALINSNVSVFDLYVAGNLVVQGETTTLNVSTLDVEDKNITIGKSLLNAASADGAGITIEGAQATLLYKVVGDKLALNKSLDIDGNIRANSWTGLYTSNVIETTNQYFTNARVLSNIELMSINVFADVDITGIQNNGILLWNGSKFVAGAVSAASTSNIALFAYVAETANTVRTGADLTLGNVSVQGLLTVSSSSTAESYTGIEFVNNPVGGIGDTAKLQYYGVGSGDDTVFEISVANNPGDSINFKTIGGGVGINRDRPTADFDVNGNVLVEKALYVVGTTYGQDLNYNVLRANSLIINGNQIISADGALSNISVNKITANVWNNLYTANVIETAGNLYFTNARVVNAVNPLLTTANVIETSGNLYFTTARVNATVQPFLTTANVIETAGNLYFTNARVVSALIAGDQIIIEANGRISANVQQTTATSLDITTADVRETSNLYYTNARVVTAVNPLLTTANVIESPNNLYFTNTRVLIGITTGAIQGNVAVTGLITSNNIVANDISAINGTFTNSLTIGSGTGGTISGIGTISTVNANVYGNLNVATVFANTIFLNGTNLLALINVTPFLTTANVVESSSNLYFTTDRVNATVQPFLTTANVVESSSNLYYTNARVLAALVNANIAGNLTVQDSITTNVLYSSTIVGTGVGIPTISSSSNILLSAGVVNVSGNLVVTGRLVANLTTADITEVSSNLYFTNARVLSSLVNENVVVSNLTVLNAVSYANVTQIAKVYQYYNESTQSLDTVFL